MTYQPMPDDYRERIKIARERLGISQAGDEYELKVLRERVKELEEQLRDITEGRDHA